MDRTGYEMLKSVLPYDPATKQDIAQILTVPGDGEDIRQVEIGPKPVQIDGDEAPGSRTFQAEDVLNGIMGGGLLKKEGFAGLKQRFLFSWLRCFHHRNIPLLEIEDVEPERIMLNDLSVKKP